MEEVMRLANSGIVWIIATLVLAIVVFQAIKFIMLAAKTSKEIGMSTEEVHSALKTGAIAAIGPSFAIIIVAISLIPLLGDPLTLMRIGIIGSAPIESVGASLGADAYGTGLGSSDFNYQAFTTVAWTLCLGGVGWLVFTALATKSMSKVEKKVTNKSEKSKKTMMVVTTAAMVAAFGNLASAEMIKGFAYILVVITASITMIISTSLANKHQLNWLREWSLGFSIIAGLFVGYFAL
ncbi:DUF5058 family protein [Halobacillus shinanisalinarum]|uniref:DUF5058 family protein n=1 Tax=Halobacillus shinanisalinarum TaxID=2932258 RepID=A0ABY4H2X4_9BACI|nr:DUF5058 family protein [Halobacillus shinanisalinarum]UOQ94651.1 DUF5058 family protein [Halobacillus shinanisalinarum]